MTKVNTKLGEIELEEKDGRYIYHTTDVFNKIVSSWEAPEWISLMEKCKANLQADSIYYSTNKEGDASVLSAEKKEDLITLLNLTAEIGEKKESK